MLTQYDLPKDILSVEDIAKSFSIVGIDVETIDFPNIGLRNRTSAWERYNVYFRNVRFYGQKADKQSGTPSVLRIEGEYIMQSVGSERKNERWLPGTPVTNTFVIENGKLRLS